jgi:hypothetical protein
VALKPVHAAAAARPHCSIAVLEESMPFVVEIR